MALGDPTAIYNLLYKVGHYLICKLVSHGVNLFIPGHLFSIKMYFCTTFLKIGVTFIYDVFHFDKQLSSVKPEKCFI